jgi:hypothetical protein
MYQTGVGEAPSFSTYVVWNVIFRQVLMSNEECHAGRIIMPETMAIQLRSTTESTTFEHTQGTD